MTSAPSSGDHVVAVLGATGRTGRSVVRSLLANGRWVRGVARAVPDHAGGGLEWAAADARSVSALREAFRGASQAYVIPPRLHPDEVALMANVFEALRAEGVERVVFHSVLHPDAPDVPHHRRKARVERLLRTSDLAWTILQPCSYAQNLLGAMVRVDGRLTLRLGYRADGPGLSVVDLEDVAAATPLVLDDPIHAFATYELAGPERLNGHQLAAALGEHLGEPVAAAQAPVLEIEGPSPLRRQADVAAYFDHYDRHGFPGSPYVLGQLLGRPPTTFAAVVERELPREPLP